ncbi:MULTISPECIES: hypothetical protein [unclassified Cobetia]|uniref:hypothetical protein n=1 Tax=unclassified Cobetia TaxID=2609414 RepID=UPI002096D268|nr:MULTISPECIES: hypothetical protein [unclassified Cobetia]MCO7230984.1 hypothetical protein [Cobetia sp. Dlab-2-AX]MCO7234609.1 hypothetical protein [Cobetia sp. Dlab-2-U]
MSEALIFSLFNLMARGLSSAAGLLLARAVAPEAFGEYALALNYAVLLGVLARMGGNEVLLVTRDGSSGAALRRWMGVGISLYALLATGFAVGIAPLLGLSAFIFAFCALRAAAEQVGLQMINSRLQRQERLGRVNLMTVLISLAVAIAVACAAGPALYHQGVALVTGAEFSAELTTPSGMFGLAPVPTFVTVSAIALVIVMALGMWLSRDAAADARADADAAAGHEGVGQERAGQRRLPSKADFARGRGFLYNNLMSFAYLQAWVILAGLAFAPAQVASVSVVTSIVFALYVFPTSLYRYYLPKLTHGDARLKEYLVIASGFALPVAGGLALIAPWLAEHFLSGAYPRLTLTLRAFALVYLVHAFVTCAFTRLAALRLNGKRLLCQSTGATLVVGGGLAIAALNHSLGNASGDTGSLLGVDLYRLFLCVPVAAEVVMLAMAILFQPSLSRGGKAHEDNAAASA